MVLLKRSPGSDAEKYICETLKGSNFSKDDISLINPIFGTFINDCPIRQETVTASQLEKQGKILTYILKKCLDNFDRTLVCIDCAQFIDDSSWEVLDVFSNDPRASVVLAYRPQNEGSRVSVHFNTVGFFPCSESPL